MRKEERTYFTGHGIFLFVFESCFHLRFGVAAANMLVSKRSKRDRVHMYDCQGGDIYNPISVKRAFVARALPVAGWRLINSSLSRSNDHCLFNLT